MTAVDKIKKEYEIGQAIFEQLFKLTDNGIKEKLIGIISENHIDILNGNHKCVRTLINERPDKIEFQFYDSIRVDWNGITLIPEHGGEVNIMKFHKYFQF